jgi:hypothetical protein
VFGFREIHFSSWRDTASCSTKPVLPISTTRKGQQPDPEIPERLNEATPSLLFVFYHTTGEVQEMDPPLYRASPR